MYRDDVVNAERFQPACAVPPAGTLQIIVRQVEVAEAVKGLLILSLPQEIRLR